jgi:hydroxyethylthiazole kinase-like uncharacterized protein yjeF
MKPIQVVSAAQIASLAPPLSLTRHKYEAGSVLAWVGSSGMMGAATLSCEAALRSGAGMVRWLYEAHTLSTERSMMIPEVIHYGFDPQDGGLALALPHTSALVGCGLGRAAHVELGLREWISHLRTPLVLDGDALFFYSKNPFPLPSQVIMTPHLGELARLLGREKIHEVDEALLKVAQVYAASHNMCLVIKGAPTWILYGAHIFRSEGGSPGMATAGCGDILAGLLAGLLAQGMSVLSAALAGVYLHQRAGEAAAKDKTPRCMIASDLFAHFPQAFRSVSWGS